MNRDSEDESSQFDRRAFLKRAAVAGAVAWTAPLVVESFTAAQAARVSCGSCFNIEVRCGSTCNTSAITWNGWPGTGTSAANCFPPHYQNCAHNAVSGTSLPGVCISWAAGSVCDATTSASATVNINNTSSCTGSGLSALGCSKPIAFLGAAFTWRNKTMPSGVNGYCNSGPGSIDTRAPTSPINQQVAHITSFSATSVTFLMPSSDKAAASGAFLFSVGCACVGV